jgi:hypothetical protein
MNYLTMKEFGKWGRFGNQLFQYAFLKTYARKYDCQLQLPPWVGKVLFGCDDPPVTVELPPRLEQANHLQQAQPPQGDEYVNHDFRGYAQYHTSYYEPSERDLIRSLFEPYKTVRGRLGVAEQVMRNRGSTWVGLHLRRGDYGRLSFYVTPTSWYLDWLGEHWAKLTDPVLFIASESPALVREFADYNPLTVADLGLDLVAEPLEHYAYLAADLRTRESLQMDFFPDWYFLSRCNVLLVPNSSFSVTAAMMGNEKAFWRSSLSQQKFLQEDPWNMYPLTHDKAEDYRHVAGVCLDETPYWRRNPDGSFKELM